MQSLREKSVIFGCCIFINARPSPKSRANSRTESDILARPAVSALKLEVTETITGTTMVMKTTINDNKNDSGDNI